MNTAAFLQNIESLVKSGPGFPRVRRVLERLGIVTSLDPCPRVTGMASPKKLQLLNRAGAALPPDGSECYLEVGTFQGKSLISVLYGNSHVFGVACDDFSLFDDPVEPKNLRALQNNLKEHSLEKRVRFFNSDFRRVLPEWSAHRLPPVGFYFYDGAHDEESQYTGIRMAEPLLADEALVLVDDWRLAPDSDSHAEAGTRRAIAESPHDWRIVHELPARHNGDREYWWNGLAILTFHRRPRSASNRQ